MGIKWSDYALKDLHTIREWYKTQAGEKVASKLIQHIIRSATLLTTHPHLGQLEPILEEFPQSFRSLVEAPHYKIIYWLEDEMVKVATIFDCRQVPQKVYQIISGRTDWVCEPQIKYQQIIPRENA